ncbi:MAG: hypothetical protein HFG04_02655 [Oscillibacter sp.]|nr:hypothetical protein [Oscillibacter sp.]
MKKQDTVYQMLDALKNGAYTAGTLALGTLGLVCEEAEKVVEAVRLRCEASRVEGELDGELMEVGELAYAAYTGNSQVSDTMEEKMRTIDGLKLELDSLNGQLGRTVEHRVCPVCGRAVEREDRFCRDCGEKLD